MRDQNYSPLDFEHHSLGGEDEDFHEERHHAGPVVEAGPVKVVRRQPGRVISVPLGGRPPPLVRQIIVYTQGFYSPSTQSGWCLINFGTFSMTLFVPSALTTAPGNQSLSMIGPLDFDIEVNEFTITYSNNLLLPASGSPNGSIWGLFVTAPGD